MTADIGEISSVTVGQCDILGKVVRKDVFMERAYYLFAIMVAQNADSGASP